MNAPIFSKDSFTLCNVPVPYGYPQSQTHVGVSFCNGKYYLTTSPYPVIKRSVFVSRIRRLIDIISFGKICKNIQGEYYENPCIYIGEGSASEPPSVFSLMQKTPLMEPPEEFYGIPSYNSDPDIFIDGDNHIFVLNRSVVRTGESKNGRYTFVVRIYLIRGIDEAGKFKLISNTLFWETNELCLSPCFFKYNNRYILAYLNSNSAIDRSTFGGLYIYFLDDYGGIKKNMSPKEVRVIGDGLLPWHMSVFMHESTLYAVVLCVRKGHGGKLWQMLGVFDSSLSELYIYKTPLSDYNSYRGAACITENGLFVLYNTTVDEKIKGSKAVDGRNVILAKMKFDNLLTKIRQQEAIL